MRSTHLAAVLVAGIACAWDLRTGRIPNILTLGAAAVAVAVHMANAGVSGGVTSVGGWLVGAAMLFLPYALGGMGAGDVKLLGALGAWFGPVDALWVAMYTCVAGGVLALVVALMHGYGRQLCGNVWMLVRYWRANGIRPMAELTLERGSSPRLAYAAPILAGTIATVWLR